MRKFRRRIAPILHATLTFALFLIPIWMAPIHAEAAEYGSAANNTHTVGLKSDGTVVAVGSNSDGQCNVDAWTNVSQISTGYQLPAAPL